QITTSALNGLDDVLQMEKPDMILVHGDTSTTFAAALAACYHEIPVGHVEAGLRTWEKYSPFPEEVNCQLTTVLADLHFSPTPDGKNNLLKEAINAYKIFVTGNTAIDALKTTGHDEYTHPVLDKVGSRRLVLMTAHRRENIGENLTQIFQAIKQLVDKHEDIHVIYPVHLNPVVQQTANEILGNRERIDLIEPLQVTDFHNFAARAKVI